MATPWKNPSRNSTEAPGIGVVVGVTIRDPVWLLGSGVPTNTCPLTEPNSVGTSAGLKGDTCWQATVTNEVTVLNPGALAVTCVCVAPELCPRLTSLAEYVPSLAVTANPVVPP